MEITILNWLTEAIPDIGLLGLVLWIVINAFIKDKEKSLTIADENHKEAMKDLRANNENLLELFLRQNEILLQLQSVVVQQKDMLEKHSEALEKQNIVLEKTNLNMEIFQKSLDRISEVQLAQATRLEMIEKEIKQKNTNS